MARVIWKYPLAVATHQMMGLPSPGRVLSAGLDPQGQACIWALVDPSLEMRDVDVFIAGTGTPLPLGTDLSSEFVGTFRDDEVMLHVFASYPEPF